MTNLRTSLIENQNKNHNFTLTIIIIPLIHFFTSGTIKSISSYQTKVIKTIYHAYET